MKGCSVDLAQRTWSLTTKCLCCRIINANYAKVDIFSADSITLVLKGANGPLRSNRD